MLLSLREHQSACVALLQTAPPPRSADSVGLLAWQAPGPVLAPTCERAIRSCALSHTHGHVVVQRHDDVAPTAQDRLARLEDRCCYALALGTRRQRTNMQAWSASFTIVRLCLHHCQHSQIAAAWPRVSLDRCRHVHWWPCMHSHESCTYACVVAEQGSTEMPGIHFWRVPCAHAIVCARAAPDKTIASARAPSQTRSAMPLHADTNFAKLHCLRHGPLRAYDALPFLTCFKGGSSALLHGNHPDRAHARH